MTSSLFDLTNKVAVVTGAAQGMGRAMSMALAEAGADLKGLGRRQTEHGLGEIRFQTVKDRFAPTRRNPARDAFDKWSALFGLHFQRTV